MKLSDIERKAKNLGIKNVWSYSKADLIRAIQKKEGNFDCFGTAFNNCNQLACCWIGLCLK
ncbi:MAG: SAP domain-containing protein [Candidatus Omnitrophota bacterium]|nr:SAP domain-containing protein [Candidatus Omnitrophota bacterium]